MPNLKFDSTDRRILAAFDSSVIIDDDNETAVITDCKIKITRPEVDKFEVVIEFAELEFPIVVLRARAMESLGVKDES